MKLKYIIAHMKVAEIYSQLSSARRLKVGAIVVKNNRIISIGYNGTPSGWDNTCEDVLPTGKLITKPCVSHAEENAITKLAKSNESSEDADIFLTHSPCMACSKLIANSGIRNVYFRTPYIPSPESSGGYHDGLDFLLEFENIGLFQVKDDHAIDIRHKGKTWLNQKK